MKVRKSSFDVVHDIIIPFDGIIEQGRNIGIITLPERLEWDIYLTTVNDLKANILKARCPSDAEYCRRVLLENMPRFMWRAVALNEDVPVVELLFDATDIEQGTLFVRAIEHNPTLSILSSS
jgi:hypothetical protein